MTRNAFDPDEHDDEELEAVRDRIEKLIEEQAEKQGTGGTGR